MAGVEAVGDVTALDGITEVKLVRADGATLRADAEEFSFHGVEVVLGVEFLLENRVEGLLQTLARPAPVGVSRLSAMNCSSAASVLAPRMPSIGDTS